MRKLGIIMHAVKGMSDEEYLKEIASLGFEATFHVPHEANEQLRFSELCEKYNIACETLHAKCFRTKNLWLDTPDGDALLESYKRCVDACALTAVPIAVVHLDGAGCTPGVTEIGCDRCRRLVDYACAKNVKIGFENQASDDKLKWVLDTFGDEHAGYLYDSGHARHKSGGDNFLTLFGDRLIGLHLHDNLGRIVEGNCDFHMIPFDGNIDFSRIVSDLKATGFDGTLMLELKYNGSTGNAHYYDELTPSEYLKRAYDAAVRLRAMIDGDPQ